MDVPFEVFSLLEGMFLVIALVGLIRQPQIPATLVIGGLFMLVIAVLTMNIELGQLVNNATTTGSTTDFTYIEDNYSLDNTIKLIFALMGVVFMLIGAGMVFTEVKTN